MTDVVLLLLGLTLGAVVALVLGRRFRLQNQQDAVDPHRDDVSFRLGSMREDLDRVAALVREFEGNRAASNGRLEEQLRSTSVSTAALADTTHALRAALASPATRGAWGERMAHDVLRHAGMIEGINFVLHKTLEGGTRPDVTFPLPGDRCLHMDVKFPLDNYLRTLEAAQEPSDDGEGEARHRRAFLRDVRARIREITSRDYIDTPAGTLDYVLLFLPNEQIYGYVHQHDPGLLDEAMRHNVILCSPLTLLAVLAVVRETVDNFALERASKEILGLLAGFRSEWDKVTEALEKLGRRLDGARKDYDSLLGVRARGIERQLDRIDQSRRAHGLVEMAATGEASEHQNWPNSAEDEDFAGDTPLEARTELRAVREQMGG